MILVDDQPYEQPDSSALTVRELARKVCEGGCGEQRRIVVAVYCDGQPVEDHRLDNVLDAPMTGFTDLELQTQPVAALVGSTLDQAIAVLDDAGAVRTEAADLLDQGKGPDAMKQIQRLLDIWRQVQQSLAFSTEAMGIDLDSMSLGDERFSDLVALMKANLGDLRAAMTNQDPVLIGDLLRYELDEVFMKMRGLIERIRDSLASQ